MTDQQLHAVATLGLTLLVGYLVRALVTMKIYEATGDINKAVRAGRAMSPVASTPKPMSKIPDNGQAQMPIGLGG